MKFDGFLTLYTEDQDDKADDEDANRLPQMATGEPLQKREIAADPAFHRAAAALFRSLAGQAHGGARHRPALDLRLDPAGAARPRLCAARQEAARPRGQGPRAGRVPGKLLRRATSNTISPPTSKSSSTRSPTTSCPTRTCCATSGSDFIGAVDDIKELRITQVIDALDEMLAPHLFPPQRRRHRSAQVPELRERPDRR